MNDAGRDARGAPRSSPGHWGALYALVIAALAVEIALLAWLTEHFR